MYRCFIAFVASLLIAGGVSAQSMRKFPPSALRGTFEVVQAPDVALNGESARLAAGARIFGPDNMLKLSASLAGQKFLVHYTVDTQGLLKDVWILTTDEAANKPWPSSAAQAQSWVFDPVAQVWSKP